MVIVFPQFVHVALSYFTFLTVILKKNISTSYLNEIIQDHNIVATIYTN